MDGVVLGIGPQGPLALGEAPLPHRQFAVRLGQAGDGDDPADPSSSCLGPGPADIAEPFNEPQPIEERGEHAASLLGLCCLKLSDEPQRPSRVSLPLEYFRRPDEDLGAALAGTGRRLMGLRAQQPSAGQVHIEVVRVDQSWRLIVQPLDPHGLEGRLEQEHQVNGVLARLISVAVLPGEQLEQRQQALPEFVLHLFLCNRMIFLQK